MIVKSWLADSNPDPGANPVGYWIKNYGTVYTRNQKIEAIKALREYSNIGLLEAKTAVEMGLNF